jgi:hypothetical protein
VAYSHLGPVRPRLRFGTIGHVFDAPVSFVRFVRLLRTFATITFVTAPVTFVRFGHVFAFFARSPRSPSSPLQSPSSGNLSTTLLSSLLFFACTIRHDYQRKNKLILPTYRHQAASAKVLHLHPCHLGPKNILLFAPLFFCIAGQDKSSARDAHQSFLLHRPVQTSLPHAMRTSQRGQPGEGRMSSIIKPRNFTFPLCHLLCHLLRCTATLLCTTKFCIWPQQYLYLFNFGRTVFPAFLISLLHDGGRL